ncbi:MAG: mRNA turnover and ribosome assembly protein [Bathelium mastoideum]|nr:MAG: mRNA turnover and ribosome assembly protein [Bathelium mastoideum]
MPKSKRAKVIHLTKTTKKGKESTEKLFTAVQEAAEKYAYCYVFSVDNMRNNHLKEVRSELADSRLFFGKTKVMSIALGANPSRAPEPTSGISALCPHLIGSVGLLFTSRPPAIDILPFFTDWAPLSYARAGTPASRSFALPPGVLYSRGGEVPVEDDVPLAASLEPTLRKWGLSTRLVKGRVELEGEEGYKVCDEGEVLDSRQTAILKQFGVQTSEFRVRIKAYWSAATGEVTVTDEGAEEMQE